MAVKVLAISVTAALLALMVREKKPVFAMLIAMAGGMGLLLLIWQPLMELLQTMREMVRDCGGEEWLLLGIRVTGMALVCDFAAGVCRDAGEDELGRKARFAGKILILAMGMPLLFELLGNIRSWLGS